MEPKGELPGSSSPQFLHQTPPHHPHQFNQNFSHFVQPIHIMTPPHGHHQFSSNQQQSQLSEPGGLGARIIRERNSTGSSSEILDLDSNCVHLYTAPPTTSQHQEPSFYRPYLMTHPGGLVNGWGGQSPQASATSGPELHSFHPGIHNIPPHPPDIYTQRSEHPQQALIYNNYIQQQPDIGFQPEISFQQNPQASLGLSQAAQASPVPTQVKSTTKKSATTGRTSITPTNPDGTAMMRGKGKGGACKRPKSYECSSCNKWFTSSGHLKRHYGTTLHKNSVQHNGGEGTEAPVGPGRGKGKKGKKEAARKEQRPSPPPTQQHRQQLLPVQSSNESTSSSSPTARNGNEGQSDQSMPQTITVVQGSYVPAPLHQSTSGYVYVGDSSHLINQQAAAQFQLLHHPQFDPNLTGNAYTQLPPPFYSNNGSYNSIIESLLPTPTSSSSTVTTSTFDFGMLRTEIQHEAQQPPVSSTSPGSGHKNESQMDESPEVGRSGGLSPPSSGSWLSPVEASPELGQNVSLGSCADESSESMEEEITTPLEYASGRNDGSKAIECPDCPKTFSRLCYLTQHQRSSHLTEGKGFKCSVCGKKFLDEGILSEHIGKHVGDKPYKCHLCPKEFNHKTDLRRHRFLHNEHKPYACADCGKTFIRRDHRDKHSEVHRRGRSIHK